MWVLCEMMANEGGEVRGVYSQLGLAKDHARRHPHRDKDFEFWHVYQVDVDDKPSFMNARWSERTDG